MAGIFEQAAEFFSLPQISSLDLTLATVVVWLKIFTILAVIAIGSLAFYLFFIRNDKRITILKSIGLNSYDVIEDHAHVSEDEDGTLRITAMFKINKQTVSAPLPPSHYRNKKGKRDHYYFFLDDNGQLQPVKLTKNDQDANLAVWSVDRRWWARKQDKIRALKLEQQSKLHIYLPSMLIIVAMITCLGMAYFAFKYLGDMTGVLGQQLAQLISLLSQQIK